MFEPIKPGQMIGIIGGGQLGRMLALSAKAMGFRVLVLDPQADCSAHSVVDEVIVAPFEDKTAIAELADRCAVITYEFENVDFDALQACSDRVHIFPNPDILRKTKNRLQEKTFIKNLGIPVADFEPVSNREDLLIAIDKIGYPSVLKTIEGGYDGKGQVTLHQESDIKVAESLLNQACILEKWVPFAYEASIIVARNPYGKTQVLPITENRHVNHILHLSLCKGEDNSQMDVIGDKLATALDLVGLLAIECFVLPDGQVLVNELAPRPHNSGHYSIEACDFSQFDLHILAITGWELPKPKLLSPGLMINILGQHVQPVLDLAPQSPDWHLHLYDKGEPRLDRKMGHITILTQDFETIIDRLEKTDIWKRGLYE